MMIKIITQLMIVNLQDLILAVGLHWVTALVKEALPAIQSTTKHCPYHQLI